MQFPRIVVTAAHCVQQKVQFRGGEFYADGYLLPADLTVTVTHHGTSDDHAVADVAASPVWRGLEMDTAGQLLAARVGRLCPLSLPRYCRSPCGVWNRASCPATAVARLWSRARRGNSIISASSPRNRAFPEIAASASERRSLATALYPSLGFIADRARALGYVP